MVFTSEVKNFIKNTLILTLFFTLVLHLSWGYIGPMFWAKTNAGANDLAFQQADINYLGSIATAMSLQLWQKQALVKNASVNSASNTISITEVLENPESGQQKLIGNNMIAISSYINLLSTDIPTLLDHSADRSSTLNEQISLLKSYYNKTLERITIINEQIVDLTNIVNQSNNATNWAKSIMESSFVGYDYSGVDGAIDTYVTSKNKDTRARVYMIYLEKFKKIYTSLQTKNLKLIDTLVNNKDALIKRTTIVIPDSGSDLIKTLKLIQTEKDANTEKTLQ